MYPMDFEEFLWANGEESLMDVIRDAFSRRVPLGPLHRRAMDAFRAYGAHRNTKAKIKTREPRSGEQIRLSTNKDAVNEKQADLFACVRAGIVIHYPQLNSKIIRG